ncbi:MAG: hypothetical protein WA862_13265 [Solirubrobacterales bacterium]
MAFGWGVRDGSQELQTCTAGTGCQQGLTGSGPGQFGAVPFTSGLVGPSGIAVDSAGDIYVMDLGNFRVQKFDSEGNFLLAFGGKVNATTGGNVCTAASGDTCVAGQVGTGPGEFSIENVIGVNGDYLDVAADGTVYVGDKDRIQAFNSDGSFKTSLPLPESGNPGALAVDPVSGNLYFAFAQEAAPNAKSTQPGIHRLSPIDGKEIGASLAVEKAYAVVIDPSGNLYAVSKPAGKSSRVVWFSPIGEELTQFGELEKDEGNLAAIATGVVGPGAGDVDIYAPYQRFDFSNGNLSSVRIYGATPDPSVVGPPPKIAPQINAQFAASVDSDGAMLRAEINPLFWNDTTYRVEYGTAPCGTSPCSSVPAAPGSKLTTRSTNESVTSPGIFLGGLTPNTTYHYRFVSQSGGSEGQEVRGVGGKVGVEGTEGTFTTRPSSEAVAPCANDSFRLNAAASLPDCRAYEMVSPVDKNNADIITLLNQPELLARSNRSAADGEKLTYSASKAFGDAISSPYSVQYMASRSPQGWLGHSISPARKGGTLNGSMALDTQFKEGFSADLCTGWFFQDTDLALAPEAVPGFPNLYKADLCGGGGYEAITRVAPPEREPNEYGFEVQGASADGSHTIFRANDKLTATSGPAGEAPRVYDSFEGGLRPVCVLPNKTAVADCTTGFAESHVFAANVGSGHFHNAVSEDGLRIYWTAASRGPGKLYLRSNTVTTTAVSKGPAEFLGAAADGSRAIYREAGQLFEFEVEEDAPEGGSVIAGALIRPNGGVVGMSEDATRVYFVSGEDLDGAAAAAAGEPNLYLHEDGSVTFIATLSMGDMEAVISSARPRPSLHAGEVTPDGETVTFISDNELTGQDSTDVNSGEADSQVYLWDAGDEVLRCVSCNRTGARPIGADVNVYSAKVKGTFWAAGLLPTPESHLFSPRVLSDDGERLFFESFDKLVSRDTNGTLDVYQWEAQGKGTCQDPKGCIQLISSGQSPQRSEFVDADASGEDVFFFTGESLLAQDPGLIDIYDARVGGGLPGPPVQPAACEGEACQGPFNPPSDPTPGSLSFNGAGNVKDESRPRRLRCGKKGKARRKGRCVSKKQSRTKAKKARKANSNRKASR